MRQLSCGRRPPKVMVNSSLPCLLWQQCGVSRHPWRMEQQTWHMILPILEFRPQILWTLWDIRTSQLQQIQNRTLSKVNFQCFFFPHTSSACLCIYFSNLVNLWYLWLCPSKNVKPLLILFLRNGSLLSFGQMQSWSPSTWRYSELDSQVGPVQEKITQKNTEEANITTAESNSIGLILMSMC